MFIPQNKPTIQESNYLFFSEEEEEVKLKQKK